MDGFERICKVVKGLFYLIVTHSLSRISHLKRDACGEVTEFKLKWSSCRLRGDCGEGLTTPAMCLPSPDLTDHLLPLTSRLMLTPVFELKVQHQTYSIYSLPTKTLSILNNLQKTYKLALRFPNSHHYSVRL